MACNCGSKDRTPDDVAQHLLSMYANNMTAAKDAVGSGIFLIPDPERGILEERVVMVDNITYMETAKRGANCVAFKWIPYSLYSKDEIIQKRLSCSDHGCASGCPGLCYCSSNGVSCI